MAQTEIVGKLENVELKLDKDMVTVRVAHCVQHSDKFGDKEFYKVGKFEHNGSLYDGDDSIVLRVPFGGAKGYHPTEDEVRDIFAGKRVHGTDMVSSKGTTYETDIVFNALERGSYNGKKFKYLGQTDFIFDNSNSKPASIGDVVGTFENKSFKINQDTAKVTILKIHKEGTYKGKKTNSTYFTPDDGTVGNTSFKRGDIRMYVPIRKSFKPTDDQALALLAGEILKDIQLKKKDGSGTYNMDLFFKPLDKFGDAKFTGSVDGEFAN